MATVFVLNISDTIVGPCLELIRRVCNPNSTSKPHITVRYLKKLDNNDLNIYRDEIPEVSFIGPDEFGLDAKAGTETYVIFIKCASDTLEVLSHKPHYPDSVFHVTLYEGNSISFAQKLKELLEKFDWKFIVKLPPQTTLTEISLKNSKSSKPNKPKCYSENVKTLYEELFSEQLTKDNLLSLSDDERLKLIERICEYLHKKTENFPKSPERSGPAVITDSLVPDDKSKWTGDVDSVSANQSGFYLTPPELAMEIAEYAINFLVSKDAEIHFGNPAVGTGVFFGALIKLLPAGRVKSAIGIEVVPQRALATSERWAHRGLEVLKGDYLHMEELPQRTLILANPPYVRYQHIKKDYGQKLRQRASIDMGMKINGQSGLYVYFLLLSHTWMANDAVAAWLIPADFMDTNYGSSVKNYLTKKVQLERLHRFDFSDTQFENALVSSAIVVFKNKIPTDDHKAIFSSGGTLSSPTYTEKIKVSELKSEDKWRIPRATKSTPNTPQIGDLFTVCRGIATGANKFFILERSDATVKGIPEEFLRPLIPKSRTLEEDIIESNEDGYPKVSKQLCVIDCDLKEEEIKKRHPQFYKYLQSGKELGVTEGALVKRRNPWYKQEQRTPPMFICTYMGRGSRNTLPIRFILNKSSAIATNSYLFLYPKEKLCRLLETNKKRQKDIFNLLQQTAKIGLVDYGRVYGGGLQKIEPKELLKVRLATFPNWLEPLVDNQLFGL